MGYKRCPRCELNYIKDTEELCDVCASGQDGLSSGSKPLVKHKGRNIFMVFQGQNYLEELSNGYICAPYEDAAGNSPVHWSMLENVNLGDIIFHGLKQEIAAISIATSSCFSSKKNTGEAIRKVNCKPSLIHSKISTKDFQEEIKITCANTKYQPFDKNADGRQGYLFDLNDNLAGIFVRALINKNPNLLNNIPELKDLKNL